MKTKIIKEQHWKNGPTYYVGEFETRTQAETYRSKELDGKGIIFERQTRLSWYYIISIDNPEE